MIALVAVGRWIMSALFWLDDDAWAVIEPHLPSNQPGARRVDDRRVISGIIHMLRSGGRWRDCPREYGPCTTVYNRFNRWSRRRLWQQLLQALVEAGHIGETVSIDSSYVRTHRSAGGAKGGPERRRLAFHVAAGRPRSTSRLISSAGRSPSC